MGVINRSRGFVFIDLLVALLVVFIGFSGVFAAYAALQRTVHGYRVDVVKRVETGNRLGTGWFAYEVE